MEWLVDGQKVQKYAIQVLDGTEWKTICSGTTIGHKKIDIFPRINTQHVRLNILSASATPRIREFQLFDGAPPTNLSRHSGNPRSADAF
jgi:alpha-L-fucosidase